MNKIIKTNAEIFAKEHDLSTEDVIYKLQHRQLVGKEIEGEWYVFSETELHYHDVKELTFSLRMLNAFFVAFAGGTLLSIFSVSTTSSFEGGAGLAGMFSFLFMFPTILIIMLFIKSAKIHKNATTTSLILGVFVILMINS